MVRELRREHPPLPTPPRAGLKIRSTVERKTRGRQGAALCGVHNAAVEQLGLSLNDIVSAAQRPRRRASALGPCSAASCAPCVRVCWTVCGCCRNSGIRRCSPAALCRVHSDAAPPAPVLVAHVSPGGSPATVNANTFSFMDAMWQWGEEDGITADAGSPSSNFDAARTEAHDGSAQLSALVHTPSLGAQHPSTGTPPPLPP